MSSIGDGKAERKERKERGSTKDKRSDVDNVRYCSTFLLYFVMKCFSRFSSKVSASLPLLSSNFCPM